MRLIRKGLSWRPEFNEVAFATSELTNMQPLVQCDISQTCVGPSYTGDSSSRSL
jgi:hypothetical protein